MTVSKAAAILLVEDDEHVRALAETTLTLAGYRVVAVRDGCEAMAELPRLRPDLVLSDLRMPRCDGWQLLQWVRRQREFDTLPFIVLSALIDVPHVRQVMALGADDYLTKPFEPEDLLATIAVRLARTARIEARCHEVEKFLARILPHELRTPLAGVLGYSELLIMAATAGEEIPRSKLIRYGENIQRSGRQLLGLAEDLSLWAEFEKRLGQNARVQGAEPREIWLAAGILEPCLRQRARHYQREADLALRLEGAVLAGLPPGLAQITGHLVDNAFKFSPPGTTVEVSGRIAGESYIFEVMDRGPGLPAEQIAQIEVLRQFGRDAKEQQGIGLGLVLARNFAHLAGGRLELENNMGLPGLTARLSLPLAENRLKARMGD
ncbi:MAG: hypothetical protein RIQ93_1450 [Verrucomicrobiota bacterium]|jgi:signal transduction histidine kinase